MEAQLQEARVEAAKVAAVASERTEQWESALTEVDQFVSYSGFLVHRRRVGRF